MEERQTDSKNNKRKRMKQSDGQDVKKRGRDTAAEASRQKERHMRRKTVEETDRKK